MKRGLGLLPQGDLNSVTWEWRWCLGQEGAGWKTLASLCPADPGSAHRPQEQLVVSRTPGRAWVSLESAQQAPVFLSHAVVGVLASC